VQERFHQVAFAHRSLVEKPLRDLAPAQSVGPGAPEDSQHVVLQRGDAKGTEGLVDVMLEHRRRPVDQPPRGGRLHPAGMRMPAGGQPRVGQQQRTQRQAGHQNRK